MIDPVSQLLNTTFLQNRISQTKILKGICFIFSIYMKITLTFPTLFLHKSMLRVSLPLMCLLI